MLITSEKVINFYNKNKHLDINVINELIIDFIQSVIINNDKDCNNPIFFRDFMYSIENKLNNIQNGEISMNSKMGQDMEYKLGNIINKNIIPMVNQPIQQLAHTQSKYDTKFDDLSTQIQNIIDIKNNSSLKGKNSEDKLYNVLVNMFPTALVKNCSGDSKTCDFLVQRDNKKNIFIENKDYKSNVPNEEIKKFIRDIEHQNSNGILLSQHTGVQNKENYQIDIHNQNILVYVHNVDYDPTKIRVAINIIDHLSKQLDLYMTNTGHSISLQDLEYINKEYIAFINKKKTTIEDFKKFTKDHLKQLETFELPNLNDLLDSKFSNVEFNTFVCKYCNKFKTKNKRSLTSHETACKKKLQNTVLLS